ncbi:MAG: peptidoglycan-binding protein, partial [Candidatus Methylumidiphilus sp.]
MNLLASSVTAQEAIKPERLPAAATKQAMPPTVITPAPQPVAAPEPSTPVALAIQTTLKQGVNPKLHWGRFSDFQTASDALYQPTGYAPLWLHDDKPTNQARLAVASLATADGKGLNPSDYDADLLGKWLNYINAANNQTPQELAAFDSALSISLMRYASNLYRGRINPKHVNFALEIEPKKEDLSALIRKIATNGNPDKLLANLEPKIKLYEHLKKVLANYRQMAKEPIVTPIFLPNKFKPGDHHADVPKLRKLLAMFGDLTEGNPNDVSPIYDKPLADAVKRFQGRHGLTEDGVIGK